MAGNELGRVGDYSPREVDDAAPVAPIDRDSIPHIYAALGIDYWQRDDFGRVRTAGNEAPLPAYLLDNDPEKEGVQPWNGDWNDIRYPPIEFRLDSWDYWRQLANYLCQRLLDLTAPANPTLTETQKAALAAQVLYAPDEHANFLYYLSNYIRHGDAFATANQQEWHPMNREYLQKMADKLLEIEKQANLPNVEMRQANRLIDQVAAEARGTESRFSASMRGFWA
jgi:hypothetical protein